MYPPPPPGAAPPPPPGYNPYGASNQTPSKNSGMGIAGFVLSLVGLIVFCFWWFQIPGLLGVIFSVIGRKQIAESNGRLTGRGLATAGLIIGIVSLALCALLWVLIATKGNCTFDNGRFSCASD